MRRLLKIIAGFFLLLIIVAVAVPFIVPTEKLKEEILAQIEAKIGRDVSIDSIHFTLFPTLGLSAEGVKIDNPTWAGDGNLIEIKSLKMGLETLPLLHKEYKLKELTLNAPVLLLIQQKGRANWEFGKAETAAPPEPVTAPPAKGELAKGKIAEQLDKLHLDKIEIIDGVITFRDETKGTTQSISDIDTTLVAPDLDEKAVLNFSAEYEGKRGNIELTLDKPFAFEIGSLTSVNLKAGFGPMNFSWVGQVSIKAGNRPFLNGTITVPSLDLSAPPEKNTAHAAAPASAKPATAGGSHWSDAPIKLDALSRADGDITVNIGSLILPKTTLKDIKATAHLSKGTLVIQTTPINAYGGTIGLALDLTSYGAMSVNFTASGAQAEPLLHDFASYDRVSGTINLATKLTASGQSQRALVGSLAGSGNVSFKDGKLKGVNLASMLRRVTGGGQGADEGTDFSELSGSFTVAKGIITNNDFKMNSPLLRVTGAGTADLPNWQEHFLLKPTLVASLEGQGGKDASGITIPVRVEGPLDHPQYQPDLKGALEENLKDPAKLKDNISNLQKKLKEGGGLKGLLR